MNLLDHFPQPWASQSSTCLATSRASQRLREALLATQDLPVGQLLFEEVPLAWQPAPNLWLDIEFPRWTETGEAEDLPTFLKADGL